MAVPAHHTQKSWQHLHLGHGLWKVEERGQRDFSGELKVWSLIDNSWNAGEIPFGLHQNCVNNVLNDIELFCASKKHVRRFFIFIRVQKYEMARGNAYVVMFNKKVPTQKCMHTIL